MSGQSKRGGAIDPRIDAALCEYLERVDSGEDLDRDEFLAQHAEIADELRSFLSAEAELRKLAGNEAPLVTPGAPAALASLASPPVPANQSTRLFGVHAQETLAPGSIASPGSSALPGPPGGSGPKTEFGRYRIVKALGKGAMGTVYLAEDTQLLRQVALKTPHFAEQPTPELLERFFREARSAATLRHANICPVYDVGQIDGTYYISMAFIEGHPLSAFIRTKQQPERQVLMVVRKLAMALQEAHDHGIVHRDLKPANIMVDKRNEPIIMDFGLARQLRAEQNVRITQSGMLIGTPAYMSPEQLEGESDKVGPPSDQYSLGVILYELLTGQLPFRGSLTAVLAQIVTKATTPPSELRSGLDPRIEAACLKMMAKNPADRFASLAAVAEELATILRAPRPKPADEQPTAVETLVPPLPSGTAAATSAAATNAAFTNTGASSARSAQESLSGQNLISLEELARKCLSRRDYEQVIQIIERVPQDKQSTALAALLEKCRKRVDEVAFLICEIDEAIRANDRPTALRKADELLAIKPGHYRALDVRRRFGGSGDSGEARPGFFAHFTRPWNQGGWIAWTALACGLAAAGAMVGLVLIHQGTTAVVIDVKDADVGLEQAADSNANLPTAAPASTPSRLPPPGQTAGQSARDSTAEGALSDVQTSDGFVPLFNGRDLTGWKIHPSQPGDWRVEKKGVLIGSGTARSHLYTERGDFRDFHLRVEARINPAGNSGLLGRASFGPQWPRKNPQWPLGYEAQINSGMPDAKTGSLYLADQGCVVWVDPSPVPADQWFTEELIAQGNKIVVKVNGATTADYLNIARPISSGHIALQQHDPNTVAEFRKVEVKEQASAPEEPLDPKQGFVLKGTWHVEGDEVIQTDAPGHRDLSHHMAPLLIFGDENWSNYNLTLEAEETAGTEGMAIVFDWLDGNNWRAFGVGVNQNRGVELIHLDGGQWGRGKGYSRPFKVDQNRWYAIEVQARGDVCRCYVGGNLRFQQSYARFTRGRIGLATWGSAVRFRRIKVTDPTGTVLWEGPPEIPAASASATTAGPSGAATNAAPAKNAGL